MILKNHVPEFQTTAVHCPICPCKILLAGKSVKTTKESIPICPKLETADGIKYWKVDEMMVFENIGFTKTDGLNQSLRYLCCADCDLGPLGFNVIGEKECYVAADRYSMLQFHTETLTPSAFLPYGTVIAAQSAGVSANQNSATRFNRLAEIKSLRNEAYPNICVFRNTPIKSLPFHIKLLERHPKSTQMFIPMSNVMDSKYLVIVCLNDKESDKPDLNTLKAFVADSKQGINYHVGMWHHPIIGLPLHGSIDFACLVYETGDKDDCEEVFYAEDLLIN